MTAAPIWPKTTLSPELPDLGTTDPSTLGAGPDGDPTILVFREPALITGASISRTEEPL
jgi:hypothetical protein